MGTILEVLSVGRGGRTLGQPTKHVRTHTHKLKRVNHFTVVPQPLSPLRFQQIEGDTKANRQLTGLSGFSHNLRNIFTTDFGYMIQYYMADADLLIQLSANQRLTRDQQYQGAVLGRRPPPPLRRRCSPPPCHWPRPPSPCRRPTAAGRAEAPPPSRRRRRPPRRRPARGACRLRAREPHPPPWRQLLPTLAPARRPGSTRRRQRRPLRQPRAPSSPSRDGGRLVLRQPPKPAQVSRSYRRLPG